MTSLAALASFAGCTGDLGEGGEKPGPAKPPAAAADPGRVTMHRLNRVEYNNTVRDLLGTALRPADDFPPDDHGYGFDNVADVQSISPLQFELYERAAEALAEEAMRVPTLAAATKVEAETLDGMVGAASGDAWNLWSSGDLGFTATLPMDGKYRVSARVWGQQAGPDPVKVELRAGAKSLGTFDVPQTEGDPIVLEAETTLPAGTAEVVVSFINDFYDPDLGQDRNLLVDWIQIEGPLDAPGKNSIRDRLLTCDPVKGGDPCVREIVGKFAERAWRRPVDDGELDRLLGLVKVAKSEGDSVDAGITLALRGVLTSPHFLFRVEADPDPTSLTPHPLSGFELASRLSYFLWSSMPDDALFQAARDGELDDPAGIEAQVTRMLADPRSDALVDNFAGQWLYIRALDDHQPDYQAFPSFDPALKDAMRTEAKLFFREFLHGDRGLPEMLTADFSFLNDRLVSHYGLTDVKVGAEFEKVTLSSAQRGGLLTQGSWLTVTSYPARTSPVKRGKWILTQLLCSEPPPPPPGVEGLKPEEMATGSLRQRMEAHRSNPVCASCHQTMDPIGFALENYDGIGAWRTEDSGFPIDATGALPTGETFDGGVEMAAVIAQDPRYVRCVVDKVYTYALGRAPTKKIDDPILDRIEGELTASGARLKDLIKLIAVSEPFRMRRGEQPKGGNP